MSTQFDSSLLSGYLDGELDADELALVERVLDEHPERLRELEALRHLQRSVAKYPTPQPTVDPVVAIRTRIEQTRPPETGAPRRWWLQATPFALAACLLLAAGWVMLASNLKPSRLASDRAVSPHSEVAGERADRSRGAGALSDEDLSSLSQFADQPLVDFQRQDSLSESAENEVDQGQRSLARDVELEQRSRPPAEPRPPMLRFRSPFDAEPRDGTRRRETASPGAMGGGFGVTESVTPEADDGIAQSLAKPAGPADAEYSFRPKQNARSDAMSLEAAIALQPNPNQPNAIRLRYGVPEEEHVETVRWLRTVVPRELKEMPPSGAAKRYWFLGYQDEQQDLQAAIKKRLEVTDGELKVVQSVSESSAMGSGDVGSRDVKASPGDSPEPTRLSVSGGQPTAIIIEMFDHPKE